MTLQAARPIHRPGHSPEWWTVSAWASLGLLVLVGLAGAVGVR